MIQWRLRQVMAAREIWTGQELLELLRTKAGVDLSHVAVMRLVKERPKQVRLATLEALCVALDCSPWEIMAWSPDEALREAAQRLKAKPVRIVPPPPVKPTLFPEEDF
ncbi:MAG: helix-turn-helix domain-containing protein [Bacillota bacterium]